ncbi:hypothetical protein [Arthrobacter pigmenti]
MAASKRRNPKLLWICIVALLVSSAATWAAILLSGVEPWDWAARVIQFAFMLIAVIYLIRFVRAQRDDYWRERGRDPKDPTRPARS